MLSLIRGPVIAAAVVAVSLVVPAAQTAVTSPKAQFGFDLGDDYQLANYKQIADYWRKLDAESDRMVVQEIGKTAEGRPHLMAIVTSPANHKNLAKYKRHLAAAGALPRASTTSRRARWREEGKAVVWIDGGLHANETLGAQQLAQMVYEMVSRTDEETMRFLDDCIILFVHANPDGNELVADWYMRNAGSGDSAAPPDCRGCIRSTSATTTTATSSRRRRRRPRTSTACSTTSGCRRSSTTITRAGRRAPSSGRRRSAIPTTTTSIRC